MAAQTEAACLIDAGAMYRRRVGLRAVDGRTMFAGFKPGAFALFDDDAPFFHFDRDGRWQRALIDGVHFLKGLDGRITAIDRIREGANLRLHRRIVPFAEANDLDALVRSTALDLIVDVREGKRRAVPPGKAEQTLALDDLLEMLERIGRWDAPAWFRHRERYLDTYGPLPILPPDARQSAVFQATLGHPGRLAFGGTPGEPGCARTVDEFADHVRQVSDLLGRRLEQCNTAFVAGADFLRQDREWVLDCLDRVRERLDERPADAAAWKGTITFADEFPADWLDREFAHDLVEHGLIRLVLGIESGSSTIRAAAGKTWNPKDLIDGLRDRPDGLALSVLTLAVAGRSEAIAETAALLRELPWKPGDAVFILDASDLNRSQPPLNEQAFDRQVAELKQAMAGQRVKVLPYSIDRQWA